MSYVEASPRTESCRTCGTTGIVPRQQPSYQKDANGKPRIELHWVCPRCSSKVKIAFLRT